MSQTQALWAYKYQLEQSILADEKIVEQLVQQVTAESETVQLIIRRIGRTEQSLYEVDSKLRRLGAMGP